MQTRTLALAGAAIVLVGTALGGGYYFGRSQQPPAAPAPNSNTYRSQPPAPQESPSEQSPPMPNGYEAAQFSAAPRFGNARQRTHRRIGYTYFRDQLARYGRWEHSDRWGQVWQPSYVDADFRPYDRGRWVDTQEFGWTWDSDYEWGAIPFHYGRWVDDPDHGWLWIPGYVWGPGWVVWRSGGHYTGWMPMPPDREFLRGDETYRNDWREETDYGYRDWYGPRYDSNRTASLWVFVDTGHMADRDYRPYEISRTEDVRRVISQTSNVTNYTTVNNYVVNQSVDVRAVEQASGRRVEAVSASVVVKKPELVIPADVGRQVQIQARQEIPTGIGKPNSAPPPSQVSPSAGGASGAGAQPFVHGENPVAGNPPSTAQAPAGVSPFFPRSHSSGQSNPAGNPTVGEERKHRFEHEQGQTPSAAQTGAGPMNAPNSASTNNAPPSVAPPQTQTGMAPTPSDRTKEKSGEGPAASVLENRNHHRAARQEELPAPPNEESATRKSGGGLPLSSSENAASTTGATSGNSEPAGFYRHGRHPTRAEQNATMPPGGEAPSAKPPPSSEKSSASERAPSTDAASGFPRGAPEGHARAVSPESGQGTAAESGEQSHKKKQIVPASVEPGGHKNAETAPGTDVRTESPPPPPDSGAGEEKSKEHKGRHKSDEPGPENAPP